MNQIAPHPNNALQLAKEDLRNQAGAQAGEGGRKRTVVMTQSGQDGFQKAPLAGGNKEVTANPLLRGDNQKGGLQGNNPLRTHQEGGRRGAAENNPATYNPMNRQEPQGLQNRGGGPINGNGRAAKNGNAQGENYMQRAPQGKNEQDTYGYSRNMNDGSMNYENNRFTGTNNRGGDYNAGQRIQGSNMGGMNTRDNRSGPNWSAETKGIGQNRGDWPGMGVGDNKRGEQWGTDQGQAGPGEAVFPKVSGKLQPHERGLFPGPDAKDKFGKEDKHLFGISMGVQRNLTKSANPVDDEVPNFVNPVPGSFDFT